MAREERSDGATLVMGVVATEIETTYKARVSCPHGCDKGVDVVVRLVPRANGICVVVDSVHHVWGPEGME